MLWISSLQGQALQLLQLQNWNFSINSIGLPTVSCELIGVQNTIPIQPYFSDWCIWSAFGHKYQFSQLFWPVSEIYALRSIKQKRPLSNTLWCFSCFYYYFIIIMITNNYIIVATSLDYTLLYWHRLEYWANEGEGKENNEVHFGLEVEWHVKEKKS